MKTVVASTILTCLAINPCIAQFPFLPLPGNTQIIIGGRRFQFRLDVPIETIREWMKSGKLKFQDAVLTDNYGKAAHYVKPDFVDDEIKGYPPIYYAASRGHDALIDLLIKNGASVERRYHGKSLAYVAASSGHDKTATKLVALGGGTRADVSSGHILYAANSQRQKEESRAATAGALAFVAALLASGSQSSGEQSGEADNWAMMHDMAQRQGRTDSVYY